MDAETKPRRLTWERVGAGLWSLVMAACAGVAVERATTGEWPAWVVGMFCAAAIYHVARIAVRDERADGR
jgi:hypothetical protein